MAKKEAALTVDGFTLSRTGLQGPAGAPFEAWQQVGEWLRYCEGSVHWWIGDWLNFGEREYGEKYSQAIEATGFEYGTVADDKWVAGQIEPSRRRENLPFAHHREVASLPVIEQESLLNDAERHGLTRQDLREKVKQRKLPPPKCHQWMAVSGSVWWCLCGTAKQDKDGVELFYVPGQGARAAGGECKARPKG